MVFFLPRYTTEAGYYGFTLDVRASVPPSIRFSCTDDNLNKHQWIFIKSRNLVCALILWRSGLGLLMEKFRQVFTELSACNTTMTRYYSLTFLFIYFYFFYFFCRFYSVSILEDFAGTLLHQTKSVRLYYIYPMIQHSSR